MTLIRRRDPERSGTGSEPPCVEVGGEVMNPDPRAEGGGGNCPTRTARSLALPDESRRSNRGLHCFGFRPRGFSLSLYPRGAVSHGESPRICKEPRVPVGSQFLEVFVTSPKLRPAATGI